MLFKKIFNKLLPCICALCFCIPALASTSKIRRKPYVNILTWWGYLDLAPKNIKAIEKACNVKISYDTYYSNDQFINRFEHPSTPYDIIIFSRTIIDAIQNKINLPKSKLYLIAKNYNPTVRKHYEIDNLPHNVVYFMHSLTGFLYNPKVIKISKSDSIQSIFHKAGKNIVVMINDPVEANFVMSLLMKNNHTLRMNTADKLNLSWTNFKKLIQNAHLLITNNPNHIITLPNFAFAFQWSGDAIGEMKKSHGKLKFLVLPKLSYISSDLLGELNLKPQTTCVAKALSGESFLNTIQNRSYYFSPYFDYASVQKSKSSYFKNIYKQTLKALPNLAWIVSISMTDFQKIKSAWNIIKYRLQQQYETL